MQLNDNSVNIKPKYHHGDLRIAVITAAMKRLEAADDLSLRKVARDVGVSATAIYRHFPDKDALLDALALEAAEMMGAEQMTASAAAGGGRAGFSACGRAYVEFALAHPTLFRLMARARLGEGAKASTAMRFLHESVDALLPAGTSLARRAASALHAWSLVHGIAILMLDGQMPSDIGLIDAVLDAGDAVQAA